MFYITLLCDHPKFVLQTPDRLLRRLGLVDRKPALTADPGTLGVYCIQWHAKIFGNLRHCLARGNCQTDSLLFELFRVWFSFSSYNKVESDCKRKHSVTEVEVQYKTNIQCPNEVYRAKHCGLRNAILGLGLIKKQY